MSNERVLHASTAAALALNNVHITLCARFDIATDPIIAWTGPGVFAPSATGDTALDGQIFTPLPPFAKLTDIVEDRGPGSPTIMEIAGHDLDEDLLQQVVRDKREWRGRSAWMWLALLDTDQFAVIDDPVRIKTGVITSIKTVRDISASKVLITIDRDLGRARGSTYRWIDHKRFVSADTWSSFIIRLSNSSQNFETQDLRNANFRDRIESGEVTFPGRPAGPSDSRLKTNIVFLGVFKGFKFYTWDWIWGGSGSGVIADEIPSRFVTRIAGYLHVDYWRLYNEIR